MFAPCNFTKNSTAGLLPRRQDNLDNTYNTGPKGVSECSCERCSEDLQGESPSSGEFSPLRVQFAGKCMLLEAQRESDGVCEGVHATEDTHGRGGELRTMATRRRTVDTAPVGRALRVGRVLVADERTAVAQVIEFAEAGRD